MRNWNIYLTYLYINILSVFIVPMRNWNKRLLVQFPNALVVFIVPMRNWNSYSVKSQQIAIMSFLSYLWGIETNFHLWITPFPPLVFIVPMRNWNISNTLLLIKIPPCFYRTYEELKRSLESKDFPPEMRFYRTYEELKRLGLGAVVNSFIVFIVPMRNWN